MIQPFQTQVTTFWKRQSNAQRITMVSLILAALVLIPTLIFWASAPTYSVAFTGLSEESAGQILQKLDESQTPYRLRDSGTILVPSDQVYQVRLALAREGLPEDGTVGFELFDGNMLGMTEFTQRVNYQRAMEGELVRTISSLEAVESVMVHLVTPEKTLLTSEQEPATASVTIQEKPGMSLEPQQVRAITHLVASSVEGLKPENVVIVDTEGNLLAAGTGETESGLGFSQSDSQHAAEASAAAAIQKKVQSLLDQALGPNKAVVRASVSMDWTQREVTSQEFDPTQTSLRSYQRVLEAENGSLPNIGGVPGAASNLPTPMPEVEGTPSSGSYQRAEETVNYEVSQVQTHEIVAPGQVKQISLAVLVDGITDTQQLEMIKTAAAAAAGIDATRGDVISVESLAFNRDYLADQEAAMAEADQMDLYFRIGEIAAAVIILVILLVFISRLFRGLRVTTNEAWVPVMKPVSDPAVAQMAAQVESSGGQVAAPAKKEELVAPTTATIQSRIPEPVQSAYTVTPEDEQLQKVITRMTEENPASVSEIIQIWLREDDKHHA